MPVFSTETDLKLAVIVIAAALLGGTGTTVLRDQMYPPRPDPFTGTDGKEMEKRIKIFVIEALELDRREAELRIKELEQSIRADMPPPATRSRIRQIENFLSGKYPDYQPPTYDWR